MSELRVVLPGFTFSISAPEEAADWLRLFYPRSISALSPDSAAAGEPKERFAIDRCADGWLLSRDGDPIGSYAQPIHALLALEFQIEQRVTAIGDGRIAVHAGAIETCSGAWLIAGDPDSGKTSSTFQLLQLEQTFLCEEIALYDPTTRAIHPYPQTLALDRRYVDEFESRFAVAHGQLHQMNADIVRFVPQEYAAGPVALELLLLPRFRPGERPHIRELQPQAVLTEVLGYCFRPSVGPERLFDAVIDLLEHTRVLRVTYGDLGQARDLYRQLLAADGAPA